MKRWLIAAAVLLAAGLALLLVVMSKLGFDFSKLGVARKETKTIEIAETFDRISVGTDTSDVILRLSEDGSCRIDCVQSDLLSHTAAVENGALVIRQEDRRGWAEKIFSWDFVQKSVTVWLPARQYAAIAVDTDTGDLRLEGLSAEEVSLEGGTGDVRISDLSCRSLTVNMSTGDADLTRVTAVTIGVRASTGDLRLEACGGEACQKLTAETSTGEIRLIDTVIPGDMEVTASTGEILLERSEAGTLKIETSTGDVTFRSADAGEIQVKTDTGDVEGSLRTEKVFYVHTDTGDVSVPKSTTGGLCEIKTDTGDVRITLE